MSKTKMKWIEAKQITDWLVDLFAPLCERIEIAGSVRRLKPEVGDIEIVCVPKMIIDQDMFGNPVGEPRLEMESDYFMHDLEVNHGVKQLKGGQKYKQFYIHKHDVHLDLFLVTPPAQWGYIYALRTGPGDFNQKIVTSRRETGALPSFMKLQDGALYLRTGNVLIPTPEEEDFYRAIGVKYLPPEQRKVENLVLIEPDFT